MSRITTNQSGFSLFTAMFGVALFGLAVITVQKAGTLALKQTSFSNVLKEQANLRSLVSEGLSCERTVKASIANPATTPCSDGQLFHLRRSNNYGILPDVQSNTSLYRLRGICKNSGKPGDPVGLVIQWRKAKGSQQSKDSVDQLTGRTYSWQNLFNFEQQGTTAKRCSGIFGGKITSCPEGFYISSVSPNGEHQCASLLSKDGLGSLGSCAEGQVLRGFTKSGDKICDGALTADRKCPDPEQLIKGITAEGKLICSGQPKTSTCTLSDFQVPVNIVAESGTSKRTWYRGTGTFQLPKDASAINMKVVGVHADDNRPYMKINGNFAFNLSSESTGKKAGFRAITADISSILKGGTNNIEGGVYDRYGKYATLIPLISGTYKTAENCP